MSASVTKAGPYFTSGEIKFSSFRTNFKETSSGPISATELRRNTSLTETNPIVPDCKENRECGVLNNGISVDVNLKTSQFRNSIKFYYITQTGTEINFDIDSQSWNTNLTKNIRKWIYLNGTCGSNSPSSAAAILDAVAYNLTVDVSGEVYGASGRGGGTSGAPDPSGESGGDAIALNPSSSANNIVVYVRSTGRVWGGGGGGERGETGANGASGTCTSSFTTSGCGGAPGCGGATETGSWSGGCCQTYCQWCGWDSCGCQPCSQHTRYRSCYSEYTVSGGTGGTGGTGGPGRGYNHSGSLSGGGGSPGGADNGCGSGSGGTGGTGGSGGDWATSGDNTGNGGSGGAAGRAVSGSNYSIDSNSIITSTTVKGLYLP